MSVVRESRGGARIPCLHLVDVLRMAVVVIGTILLNRLWDKGETSWRRFVSWAGPRWRSLANVVLPYPVRVGDQRRKG